MPLEDEANYDESKVGKATVAPLTPSAAAEARRTEWLSQFAARLYGPIPPPTDGLTWSRHPLPDPHVEHVVLALSHQGRTSSVDAALWLPRDRKGLVPLVIGLDFLGPAGTLFSDAFPLDPDAIVARPPWRGGGHGPLDETMRGTAGHRWPIEMILDAGWGMLTSCYGSWAPDDAVAWQRAGIWPLLDLHRSDPTGAISLWAWALQRLVDVAVRLSEIDGDRIALLGHSRLGKAALWAAANDARVAAVISNGSGCGGASLSSRNFGETLPAMRQRFPHWLLPERPLGGLDQHHLLASIAPRGLYVASAEDDLWADPRGEFLALEAAAPAWRQTLPAIGSAFQPGALLHGQLGWHMRPGGHEVLPFDWARFLPFLAQIAPLSRVGK